MATVIVETGQNIMDVCLQEHGNLDDLLAWHELNGCDEMPAIVTAGQVLIIPEATNPNKSVVNILARRKPATGYSQVYEGIDYWGIEVDNIVM